MALSRDGKWTKASCGNRDSRRAPEAIVVTNFVHTGSLLVLEVACGGNSLSGIYLLHRVRLPLR